MTAQYSSFGKQLLINCIVSKNQCIDYIKKYPMNNFVLNEDLHIKI